jgi:hypothetical protein
VTAPRTLAAALGLGLAGGVAGCDVPVGTTAMAHESLPWDAPTDGTPPIDGPPMASLYVSQYLGGAADDDISALAVGGGLTPFVVAVGGTASSDFPTTDGSAVDTSTTAGCSACPSDAFIWKRRSPGEQAWSTVIGGPGFERATAVALAGDGDVFVGGSAAALPATTGAADATFAGGSTAERGDEDGFVCRLDGATGAKEWCTFVGGNGSGGVQALAADWSTDTVLAALTTVASEALDGDAAYNAVFAGRHRSSAGGADTVVVRIAGNGQSFIWATYVGGTGDEGGTPSLALSGLGVNVLTTTSSSDAPAPGGLITTAPAGRNGYLATLSSDATTLRYGTYLGGAGDDWTAPDSLDAATVVYAALNTTSSDLPARDAAQATYGGGGSAGCGDGDGWIAGLRPDLTGDASLVAATYLGGSRGDEIAGLARTGVDALVVVGRTYSSDFPLSTVIVPLQAQLRGSACTTTAGNSDGFIVRYATAPAPGLSRRDLSTYVGGSSADSFVAAAAPGQGNFYIAAGRTASSDFPTTAVADTTLGGPSDGVYATPEWWTQAGPITPDGGPPADAIGGGADARDAGNAIDEGGGGCCGTSRGGSASSLLLALATLAALRRRRTSYRSP